SYMRARLKMRGGQWRQAADLFEAARPMLADRPEMALQIDLWLAGCFGQMGNPDRQLAVLQRARRIDPRETEPRYRLVDVLAALGRIDEAIAECEGLRYEPEGELRYVRLLIAKTIPSGPSAARWDEIDKILENVRQTVDGPAKLGVEYLRAEVQVQR